MYLWEWSWKNDGTDDSIPLFILVSLRSSEPPAKPLGFYSLLGKHVLFLLLHKYSHNYMVCIMILPSWTSASPSHATLRALAACPFYLNNASSISQRFSLCLTLPILLHSKWLSLLHNIQSTMFNQAAVKPVSFINILWLLSISKFL